MGFLNESTVSTGTHRFSCKRLQVLALAGHADFKDLNEFLVHFKKIQVCAGGRDGVRFNEILIGFMIGSSKIFLKTMPNSRLVINMCQGLNSHYFHIIGDKLINPIVGVYIYTHYKDFY